MNWYIISYSGEYVVIADSEEEAREIFNNEEMSSAFDITIDSIKEMPTEDKLQN